LKVFFELIGIYKHQSPVIISQKQLNIRLIPTIIYKFPNRLFSGISDT